MKNFLKRLMWWKKEPEAQEKELPKGTSITITVYPDESVLCEYDYPDGAIHRLAQLIFSLQKGQYTNILYQSIVEYEGQSDAQVFVNTYNQMEKSHEGLARMIEGLTTGDEYEPPIVCPTDVFPMFSGHSNE